VKIQANEPPHREEKEWGYEEWIVNNEEYCGKLLVFKRAMGATSMHFHVQKRETMLCLQGEFVIRYIDTDTADEHQVQLTPGMSVEIPRLLPHSICAILPDSVLVEFSTQHFNEDSFRLWRYVTAKEAR
jgi:D-lyxose ketol-isomerase